jgi:uncharacterized repeat protein (TIGR03803 family)
VAAVILSCVFAASAHGQTFTMLASFTGGDGDALNLQGLIQATDGNYYGATQYGGQYGHGVVFQVTPAGNLTAIHDFCSDLAKCKDGSHPETGPVLGQDGNLYGTTGNGGSTTDSGTFFKVTLGGKLTTLYRFCLVRPCPDGQYPVGLFLASNGNFVGASFSGGDFHYGTIFEISPLGNLRVLHTFCSLQECADGANPVSAPIQASNGNFYGTTSSGGQYGHGVVYELTAAGGYRVLHEFCSQTGCSDGRDPWGGLVQDAAGNFYGTTPYGGAYGFGTAFEITSASEFVLLHSFDPRDGAVPWPGLTLANDGNLYGTTSTGSVKRGGDIFEISSAGVFTQLYSFCTISSCPVSDSTGALLQGTDGDLYGTSSGGGAFLYGSVFSLSNNLGPLVETVPTMGIVGTQVIILGTNLTGSTSLTFNGTPATFTVASDTYITATVPTGATTGTIQVTTPTGTLNSNPAFQVLK